MPGPNLTGTPDTRDYNLGRGIVYFARLDADEIPADFRDLGNAPEFNVNVEVETLEHQSSRRGLQVTDLEVTLSQKMNISLTLDEINFENLALFFAGNVVSTGIVNLYDVGTSGPVVAAVGSAMAPLSVARWYDLRDVATRERAYDLDEMAGATVDLDLTSGMTPLVEGDENDGMNDYKVDRKFGRIFIWSNSPNFDGTANLNFDITGGNMVNPVAEVRTLLSTSVSGALKFISENPANSDHQTEFQFHKIKLKAEGDFSLIGNEFTQMQLQGVAERNETAFPQSPSMTIRDIIV